MLRAMGWGGFFAAVLMSGCRSTTTTTGPSGVDGVTGTQGPAGVQGDEGPEGPQGVAGADGEAGAPGQSCWDLDGDGIWDFDEDVNLDGVVDVYDCRDVDGGGLVLGPRSGRTVLHVHYNLEQSPCSVDRECCPDGFTAMGLAYQPELTHTLVCYEDAPGTLRDILEIGITLEDDYYCFGHDDADPCCPDDFTAVGYNKAFDVVCLADL